MTRRTIIMVGTLAAVVSLAAVAAAAPAPASAPAKPGGAADAVIAQIEQSAAKTDAAQGGSYLKLIATITVLSVAPAILVMVTSFTRVAVVLGLLRQALATHQLPPNQVLFGLALLVTAVVMAPVYRDVHASAVGPYLEGKLAAGDAVRAGEKPVREFMIRQIRGGQNEADVYLFLDEQLAARDKLTWQDVPTTALIPAFVVSELKIAFLMGFRIFLPFLVIDMLVASVLVSMGMLMLPPVLVSLPFKLLLFVLADGWRLVVGTLMTSFG